LEVSCIKKQVTDDEQHGVFYVLRVMIKVDKCESIKMRKKCSTRVQKCNRFSIKRIIEKTNQKIQALISSINESMMAQIVHYDLEQAMRTIIFEPPGGVY
jgi:hypothetical protein